MQCYTGAARLPGRFSEGFCLRRLQFADRQSKSS